MARSATISDRQRRTLALDVARASIEADVTAFEVVARMIADRGTTPASARGSRPVSGTATRSSARG